ncbi:3'-5' exonuclease [bacterium]|nr:3'-5' exonuclease [bacterium]
MLNINRPCPHCHTLNSLSISKNTLSCNTCELSYSFNCPLCNTALNKEQFKEDAHGPLITCSGCKKDIHLRRIQSLFNNIMHISHDERCNLCNGPTVYRQQANIGHRCFFYPKCSGQTSLFNTKKESLVFLDFETSGLEPGKDHIIEIGALKIDEEGFEHTFDTFVHCPVELSEKITKITKITNDMLKNAHQIKDIIQDFQSFIGDATIIAHNAEFDVVWLLTEYLKQNINYSNNDVVCTYKWAQAMKEPRSSLSALTKKYKVGHLNAHRALADAAVTKELFFVYENAQLESRPTKPLNDYMNIVTKLKDSQIRKLEKAALK